MTEDSTPDPVELYSGIECAHCGLPVPDPENSPSPEPKFCCTGCQTVYHALRGAGLQSFYNLRNATYRGEPKPAQIAGSSLNLDGAEFLTENSTAEEDGTRCIELYLDGVHCAGCVWIVERMPQMLPGVAEARLDLPRARLSLRWNQEKQPLSKVSSWLAKFGYAAHPIREKGTHERSEAERKLLVQAGVSWTIAGNVMLLASALYAGLNAAEYPTMTSAALWASLVLSGGSIAFGGRTFLRRAWASLSAAAKTGSGLTSLSMDVPISLGILVGWIWSAWATVQGSDEVWFDSIAVLIAALLTARWLQVRGRRKAGDAADRLLALLPRTARRVDEDLQNPEEISAENLLPGDLCEVRAGEVIPADGKIIHGSSTLHRGVLTGESRPEKASKGEEVHAGTTNLGSPLWIRVEASGDETRVGKLLNWVEERTRTRAPMVQKADRWSGYFVLAVLVAAGLTAAAWTFLDPSEAIACTVALLVVSCPCALGMATPLALTVAVGQAAQRGIFIKNDDVIERLTHTTHIVLDKTGTLTEGSMTLLDLEGDENSAILASSLERHSEHPIARAFVDWSRAQEHHPPSAKNPREEPGAGVEGSVNGQTIRAGKPEWILKNHPEDTQNRWTEITESIARKGHTPILVEESGEVRTALGFGDPLRPSSFALLQELRRRDITPILLSGDHPHVVKGTASTLQISPEFAHGGVSPEEKQRFVENLKAEGATVIMIGDGVNDAAALQSADIGISVQGGTQVSLVAADIFTTRPGLEPAAELLQGADRVLSVVHRNLFASLGYNVLGVTLAALGFVTPLLAAVAMPISSLGVVASSLLQRSFRAPS